MVLALRELFLDFLRLGADCSRSVSEIGSMGSSVLTVGRFRLPCIGGTGGSGSFSMSESEMIITSSSAGGQEDLEIWELEVMVDGAGELDRSEMVRDRDEDCERI